jgi:hypothetical protein
MRVCLLRQLFSIFLICSLSVPSFTADESSAPAAILHTSGKVQVNRTGAPGTLALFSGDSVDTQSDSVANITSGGNSILVLPNSSVQLQRNAVELSRGDVVIATSSGLAAKAGEFTIAPVAQKQSKFEISENDDSVTVAAQQGNVTVSDGQESATVQEGQQTTREKKKKKKAAGVPPTTEGGFISGKTIAILGGASGAALAGILIAEKGPKKCVSPSGDKKCKCKKDKDGKEDCHEE